MKILKLFLFGSLTLLFSCSADVSSPTGKGQVYIMSLGIDYSDSMVSTLYGTVADAAETASCFTALYESKGINCTEIFTSSTNAKCIVEELLHLNVSEDDLIVFYFSGHGSIDENGAFLACSKTDDNEYTKLYMNNIYDLLSDKNCRCLIILDCCYAGSMVTEDSRSFTRAISEMFKRYKENKVCVIASSLKNQVSLLASIFTQEGNGERHSLFTLYLLRALGWKHSSELKDGGFIENVPSRMTSDRLFQLIIENWNSDNQTPVMNRTDIPVLIIP